MIPLQEIHNQQEDDLAAKLKSQRIVMCRVCKGDHWTTKCPYKDSLEPLQKELLQGGGGSGGGSGGGAGSDSETGGGSMYSLYFNNIFRGLILQDLPDLITGFFVVNISTTVFIFSLIF